MEHQGLSTPPFSKRPMFPPRSQFLTPDLLCESAPEESDTLSQLTGASHAHTRDSLPADLLCFVMGLINRPDWAQHQSLVLEFLQEHAGRTTNSSARSSTASSSSLASTCSRLSRQFGALSSSSWSMTSLGSSANKSVGADDHDSQTPHDVANSKMPQAPINLPASTYSFEQQPMSPPPHLGPLPPAPDSTAEKKWYCLNPSCRSAYHRSSWWQNHMEMKEKHLSLPNFCNDCRQPLDDRQQQLEHFRAHIENGMGKAEFTHLLSVRPYRRHRPDPERHVYDNPHGVPQYSSNTESRTQDCLHPINTLGYNHRANNMAYSASASTQGYSRGLGSDFVPFGSEHDQRAPHGGKSFFDD